MDAVRAKRMTRELTGSQIGDWTLVSYINCGKSALVFKAEDPTGSFAAVKIFDPEIVERFGDQKQLQRIEREKSLIGKSHPNLIKIFDGGTTKIEDTDYFYVVMEFLPLDNLADVLHKIPVENIWPLISKVASAARFLEDNGLCHRDIKPENIICDETGEVVKLLDLGVLRPLTGSNLTDEGRHPFIGTLQYSSPEYLRREEEDTEAGWRALTFYQLGAVLHDLIMRVPIFQEFAEPFTKLSNAVQHQVPVIASSSVPPNVVALASNCLAKVPSVRLQTVKWSDFTPSSDVKDELTDVKQRMAKRRIVSKIPISDPSERAQHRAEKLAHYAQQLRELIREVCLEGYLPRQIFEQPETLTSGSVRLVVQFVESTEEQLFVNFAPFFDISWLDDQDDTAIRIDVCAIVSKEKMKAPPDLHGKALYKGVYLAEPISKVIQTFLYLATEKAQEYASWRSTEKWASIDTSILKDILELPSEASS